MSDIEIARSITKSNIEEVASKISLENNLINYGKYMAKIDFDKVSSQKSGKLILVTSINPTIYGEGKTTVSIGLVDGLCQCGKNAVATLREPSLGPVFGMKGGATGGGHAQIAPMEDINLHFTGDMHAITSANNLLSAMIDNHIYQGNKLNIEKVTWKRCIDLNDRQLRKINTGLSGESKIVPREDGFDISAASEIMAILCLATDIQDLKTRLGNIIVGYNKKEEPVFAKDLNAQGAMTVLLKDAIKPNLVQTLEHTPALVHGGPFANIAHGCNSVIATRMGMKLAEYTVTEAGFGADLGAEKFIDIKCRDANIKPNVVVCVATIKALKYHGGASKENIREEDMVSLEKGMNNLYKHIDNIRGRFGLNVIVAINKYNTDKENELEFVQNELAKREIPSSVVESWEKGGEGALDIANKIVELADQEEDKFEYIYDLDEAIVEKINKIAMKIYGAKAVLYPEEVARKIEKIEEMGYGKLPICIAKTQYSFSDDAKNLECEEPFEIHVKDVELKAGAGFIVVLAGNIMTMPGLPVVPAAENIDIDEAGNIVGLF